MFRSIFLIELVVVLVVLFLFFILPWTRFKSRFEKLEQDSRKLKRRLDWLEERAENAAQKAVVVAGELIKEETPAPAEVIEPAKATLDASLESYLEQVKATRGETSSQKVTEPDSAAAQEVQPVSVTLEPRERPNLEQLLAGKWMAILGAIALLFGVGFFLKYLIEHGYLTPAIRVTIGIVTGVISFTIAFIYMRKGYIHFSQAMAGTALGFFLISFFAAHQWYQLMSQEVALAGMIVGIALTLSFAIYFHVEMVAILGLIGGFLAPLLLNTGVDRRWEYFSYIFLLDLAVLLCAAFRKWRKTEILALMGTIFMWQLWMLSHYQPEKLWDAFTILTGFFFLFSLLGPLHHLIWRRPSVPTDYTIILITPVLYFAQWYAFSEPQWKSWQGSMAAALSVYFFLFWLVARLRTSGDVPLRFSFFGLSAGFLTLAIPLQFTGYVIALGWTLLGTLKILLGLKLRSGMMRAAGLGLLVFVAMILLQYIVRTMNFPDRFDGHLLPPMDAASIPMALFFNSRSLSFVALIASCGFLAWMYRRSGWINHHWDQHLAELFISTGAVLFTIDLLLETYVLGYRQQWSSSGFATVFSTQLAGSVVLFMLIALVIRSVALSIFAFILVCVNTIFHLFGLGDSVTSALTFPERGTYWTYYFISPWGITFLAGLLSLVVASWVIRQKRVPLEKLEPTRHGGRDAIRALGFLSLLLIVMYATYEICLHSVLEKWYLGRSLSVSLTWTILATTFLVLGIFLHQRGLRLFALALFLFTSFKVFVYDIWQLDVVIRYIAFTALGVALLLTSFLYQRYRYRIGDWVKDQLTPGQKPSEP